MASIAQNDRHKQVICAICDKEMKSNKLNRHMKTHEVINGIACSMCSEHFPDEETLYKHCIEFHYESKTFLGEENELIQKKENASH